MMSDLRMSTSVFSKIVGGASSLDDVHLVRHLYAKLSSSKKDLGEERQKRWSGELVGFRWNTTHTEASYERVTFKSAA